MGIDMSRHVRPPTRRPARRDVREQILAAASELFRASGYAETTVADVAARAGFTKGAVYSNFGGKPELFGAVWAERFGAVAGLAIATSDDLSASGSGRDVALDLARSLTQQVVADPSWAVSLGEFRLL